MEAMGHAAELLIPIMAGAPRFTAPMAVGIEQFLRRIVGDGGDNSHHLTSRKKRDDNLPLGTEVDARRFT